MVLTEATRLRLEITQAQIKQQYAMKRLMELEAEERRQKSST